MVTQILIALIATAAAAVSAPPTGMTASPSRARARSQDGQALVIKSPRRFRLRTSLRLFLNVPARWRDRT